MSGTVKAEDWKYDWEFRYRYETLRAILNRNGRSLKILSDLEADLNHLVFSDSKIRRSVKRLFDETYLMAQELNLMSRGKHSALLPALDRIRRGIKSLEQRTPEPKPRPLAVRLDEEDSLDPLLAGGKAAGLASLHRHFPGLVPEGFVLTTAAYDRFLEEGSLAGQIRILLKDLEFTSDRDRFRGRTAAIREAIAGTELPEALGELLRRHGAGGTGGGRTLWAVRSSAVNEDGRFSFAGQFDSLLNVPSGKLAEAYKEVVAGKFSERAIAYRLNCGFREVDTPMAVLFMPMIDPQAAGVVYTADPLRPDSDTIVINCVRGLGDKVVRGIGVPDHIEISRQPRPEILAMRSSDAPVEDLGYLSRDAIREIGATAWKAMTAFGYDMDIEWALDRQDRLWLLQGRRTNLASPERIKEVKSRQAEVFLSRGVSIFPGLAEGPVARRSADNLAPIPRGAVLVVAQPTPELAPLLPDAAAVVAAEGSPVGHLATLLREFAVPSLFQAGGRVVDLADNTVVSVDASMRKVYRGSCWPGMRERVLSRLSSSRNRKVSGPLYDLVLSLNLTDPFGPDFKPGKCRSVHDCIRYIHEMSVRAMFRFGDAHSGFMHRKTWRLESDIPMPVYVLALEQALPEKRKTIGPGKITSAPFAAFWKGFSDARLAWPDRWGNAHISLSRDLQDQVFGGTRGPRKRGDPNYLIYASDYMNFNARFAYHYAMVDSLLGGGDRNNYIQLRFHSGGGSDIKRERRALFLERVLRECRFGVTREGDLITAWFRNYPAEDTAKALEALGRLLVCSRQLDMLMHMDSDVKMYSDNFLAGKFQAFV
jgi:pyruvate,water dikinase